MRADNFKTEPWGDVVTIQYQKNGGWTDVKQDAKEGDTFKLENLEFDVGVINKLSRTLKLSVDRWGLLDKPSELTFNENTDDYFIASYYEEVEVSLPPCTDSDGGIQKYVYGTVFYGSLSGSDVCEGGILNNVGDILYERYCDSGGNEKTEEITCELGCVDGVCRKSSGNDATTKILCEDTESGKDYNKGGMVSHGEAGTPPSSMTPDKCIDSNTLKEVYCENGYYAEETINCSDGCLKSTTEYGVVHGIYFYNTGCNPLTSLTSCIEEWTCTSWSTCPNNQQTRTCIDSNNCGTTDNKPKITKSCDETCVEDWSCISWSSCTNEQQIRTCTDSNNCGTTINKPIIQESCTIQGEDDESIEDGSEGGLYTSCSGCLLDDKCYAFGYRKSGKYCSDESNFVSYKDKKESCSNNFECKSNVCVNDECVSGNLMRRILNWFRRVFGRE